MVQVSSSDVWKSMKALQMDRATEGLENMKGEKKSNRKITGKVIYSIS